jgi:accessory gene regulator B
MEWLVQKTIGFIRLHVSLPGEDIDIYEYGLEILIADIITFAVTFIVAAILNVVFQTVFYYIAFIGLRRCAGGYHASTRMRCFVISMSTWLIAMWIIGLSSSLVALSILFSLISCAIIWLFAPVENHNNPLSAAQEKRMKRISRIYSTTMVGAAIVATALIPAGIPDWIAASLAYGMLFFSISLTVAAILRHRGQRKTRSTIRCQNVHTSR